MARFKVTFHKCIQDSQDYGGDDQHMVSRVFFSFDVDGRKVGDFSADIKQVVGADFDAGAIEVGPPDGYHGAFDQYPFVEAATKYFLSLVGAEGHAIRVVGGGNVRMRNNLIVKEAEFSF